MKIRVGKFILRSDGFCYWIEEEYIGKSAKGKEKLQTRLVTGYATSVENLIHQFVEHKHRAIGADTMTKLIRELKQVAEDTEAISKAALKGDFKKMSELKKEIKEINK